MTIWVKNVVRYVIEYFNFDVLFVFMGIFVFWWYINVYNLMLDDCFVKDCVFVVGLLCVTVAFIVLYIRSFLFVICSMISIIGVIFFMYVIYYEVYR